MKKRYIEDWIFYWIALCVKGFFSLFPYRIGVAFGAGVIYGLSFFYSRRFSVAYLNLKSTFPDKEPSEIKWLIRRSMFNMGLSLMEFMLSPKLDRKKLLSFVDIKGIDDLKEKLAAKSGLIFLTAHYNSWELLPFVGDLLGLQMYVIAREQKYPRLNRLLNDYRSRWGCVVVEKGFSLKTIFRVLKEGKSIGILADQNAGRNGIQVKFFGRFASTNPGFISIARATKSDVRPVFLRRTGIFKHEMKLYPNMDLNKPDQEILSEYNSILERYIRNNPEQWLWFHKRWKHSVNKNILIISDGKPGHYKQSEMVAETLKQLLIEKNIREWDMPDEELIKIQEVELVWRKKWFKNIIYILGILLPRRIQGSFKFLKLFIDDQSYSGLFKNRYNYIISAGSSVLPLNVMVSYENSAANVHILSPGFYKDKLKLVLVPEHDEIYSGNAVSYKGSLIDNEKESQPLDYLEKIGLRKDSFKISLLIGGDSRKYRMRLEDIKPLFFYIDKISSNSNIDLMITTSRRTPKPIENFLKEYFASKDYLRLLIIANEGNPAGAYNTMLNVSDLIIATSDSISMISEPLSLSKRLYVFKTEKLPDKNKRFIQKLEREGLLKIINLDSKDGLFTNQLQGVKLDNKNIIKEALKQVV